RSVRAMRDTTISGSQHATPILSAGPSRSMPAQLSTVRRMMDRTRCTKTVKHFISSQTVMEGSAGEIYISQREPEADDIRALNDTPNRFRNATSRGSPRSEAGSRLAHVNREGKDPTLGAA